MQARRFAIWMSMVCSPTGTSHFVEEWLVRGVFDPRLVAPMAPGLRGHSGRFGATATPLSPDDVPAPSPHSPRSVAGTILVRFLTLNEDEFNSSSTGSNSRQTSRIGRRGLLAAAAIVGLTGGAASAARPDGLLDDSRRPHWPWPPRLRHLRPRAPRRPRPRTPTPPPPPPGTVSGTRLIGMSAPAGSWDQRVREVGAGLAARRIFADLGSGATSQIKLVEQAHAAGHAAGHLLQGGR